MVAGGFLWMFGPALLIGQVARDIRHIANTRTKR